MKTQQITRKASTAITKAANASANNPRLIVGGLLLIGGFFAANELIKIIKSFGTTPATNYTENIAYDVSQMSVSTIQADIILQSLFDEMNQNFTNDTVIVNLLSGLNKNDLLYLIKKFGVKDYVSGHEAVNWFDKQFSSPKNLIGWIREDIGGSELEEVRQIFSSNGIPF